MYTNAKPQAKYDPYSSTYNPGWRDHPNFKWGRGSNQATNSSSFQPQQQPKWGEATSKLLMPILPKAMDHTKGGLILMPKDTG